MLTEAEKSQAILDRMLAKRARRRMVELGMSVLDFTKATGIASASVYTHVSGSRPMTKRMRGRYTCWLDSHSDDPLAKLLEEPSEYLIREATRLAGITSKSKVAKHLGLCRQVFREPRHSNLSLYTRRLLASYILDCRELAAQILAAP